MLTDTFLRNAKPKGAKEKFADGGGLYIHIAPTGGKLWRMAYRFEGKQKTLYVGAYPAVSLRDARNRRDEAKILIANGIDPSALKQACKASEKAAIANSFEGIAREWFGKNEAVWSASHRENTIARLEKDVFPPLGGVPIADIEAPQLLNAIRQIEKRGAVETAYRVLSLCGQVFRYGIVTGRCKRDVAQDLRGALEKRRAGHFAAITDPKRLGELLRDIDAYQGSLTVRYALQIAPYVFTRPSELRCAEWCEFDFEKALWTIPTQKMKTKQAHLVPLATQVIARFEELREYTGDGIYLFPSERERVRPISDMSLLSAVRRLGYGKDEVTVHGFRATASTMLNGMGYVPDVIERQLAHGEKDKIRAAYHRTQYMDERRTMMQAWADYLDGLRNPT